MARLVGAKKKKFSGEVRLATTEKETAEELGHTVKGEAPKLHVNIPNKKKAGRVTHQINIVQRATKRYR